MSSDHDLLVLRWRELKGRTGADAEGLELPTIALDQLVAHGSVRIAVNEEGGPRLLIPIDMAAKVREIEEGRVAVRSVVFGAKGRPLRFLDVSCRDRRLDDVFAQFVSDVLRRLELGGAATESVERAMNEFRTLLQPAYVSTVPREKAIGLIGELMVLERLLKRSPDWLSSWVGPAKQRHDFVSGSEAIEVKTSVRAHERKVEVHAIDQLEARESGDLHLIHHVLEIDADGKLSVPMLIERIRPQIADVSLFERKLAESDYHDRESDAWAQHVFQQKTSEVYRITEGFPRITQAELKAGVVPTGISRVTYMLNLEQAQRYRVNQGVETFLAVWAEK